MFKIVLVTGHSMIPTLQNGERVLAWTPVVRKPFKRGEIVTLFHIDHIHLPADKRSRPNLHAAIATTEQEPVELFVKRIVGLPGDTIRIPVNQLSPHTLTIADPQANRCGSDFVWHIPDGHVFVQGDGPHSIDSVVWGSIPFTQLKQIVLCRFPSFKRIPCTTI
ncbi:Signal peptidase I [hydrothermal vent metagenome]|uniref:Signal peptidase I n=1 Tax=hydrothermal vent metagenome TaxID=652676 RepID=A0A3B0W1Z9_9ZZZZ